MYAVRLLLYIQYLIESPEIVQNVEIRQIPFPKLSTCIFINLFFL